MDKRLKKAVRLLSVQKKLHSVAEWKFASLQRRASDLQDAQAALIETLNNDELLYGLFIEARAQRLQSLAAEAGRVKQAQEIQKQVVLERAMQAKRTERRVGLLSAEHRREVEKKEYFALLDGLATKSDASLP